MRESLYNLNIEMTVLSSLIQDNNLIKKYHTKLKSKLFYLPCNKEIFECIMNLYENEKPINEIIIQEVLNKKCEDTLGFVIVSNAMINIESYINILNDYNIKREIKSLALNIENDLKESSAEELYAKVNVATEKLFNEQISTAFEIENIKNIKPKDVEFICKDWLPMPKRTVSIIASPGGVGKSWLIMQLAIRAVQNKDVNKAFLWLSEDPKEITKHRYNQIKMKLLKYKDKGIDEKIDISDSPTIQMIYEEQRKNIISPLFYQFKSTLDSYDLIILDPLIAFYGADENNNASARQFMQLFTYWANKENKTIIFIHHSTKNTTQSRGASAFVDAVRVVYEMDKLKDKDGRNIESNEREIKLTKDNYGARKYLEKSNVRRTLFPKNIKQDIEEEYGYEDF